MRQSASGNDRLFVEALTSRELEVLYLLAQQRSNLEIADELVLSLNTVKWYARQIYGKLGVENRRQAVIRARELDLLSEEGSAGRIPNNLPAQLTPFLGRDRMLAELDEWMSDPDARILTIVGPGGMGKTRLAMEAASLSVKSQRSDVEDGVFFIPLAALGDPGHIVSAVAHVIGFQFYPGPEAPEEQLAAYMCDKQMLLILDDFEHLVDPIALRLLADLLAAGPRIKLLVTSRTRLNMLGEHVIVLDGMAVPDCSAIGDCQDPDEQAASYSSIRLFVECARRLWPEFELRSDNLLEISRICSLMQGMPLGIELAAAWTAILDPEEILAEIETNFDFLATNAGGLPERHRSLRTVFDTSWDLLTESERAAVQALVVFEGGFDRPAAEAAGVVLGTLLTLVAKSWVQRSAFGRFEVHELLRHYGLEQLARNPDREGVVRERHSRYYCEWVCRTGSEAEGRDQDVVLSAIRSDLENVRGACMWAASEGCTSWLEGAVHPLGLFYYQWRGTYQAGLNTFRAIGSALVGPEGWPNEATRGARRTMVRILVWQSTFCGLAGDQQLGEQLVRDSVALLEGPALAGDDTRFERAHVAWQSGYLCLYTDPAGSLGFFSESVELYRVIDNRLGVAAALLGHGRAARETNDLDSAQQSLADSLSLQREIGNRHGEAETLATLGGLAIRQGDFAKAEELIQEGLAITPRSDRYGRAFGLGFLGTARMFTGRYSEAAASLEECISLHRDLGMLRYALDWDVALGQVHVHSGSYREARAHALHLISRSEDLEYLRGASMGLILAAQVDVAEGEYEGAERRLEGSAAAFPPAASGNGQVSRLGLKGLVLRGLNRRGPAWRHLLSALDRACEARELANMMLSIAGIALLLADEAEPEKATELYALASRHPLVAESSWYETVIGKPIQAATASLPAGMAGAALERGKALNLDRVVTELIEERDYWAGNRRDD